MKYIVTIGGALGGQPRTYTAKYRTPADAAFGAIRKDQYAEHHTSTDTLFVTVRADICANVGPKRGKTASTVRTCTRETRHKGCCGDAWGYFP